MAHSLTPAAPPPATTATPPLSTKIFHLPSLGFQRVWTSCPQGSDRSLDHNKLVVNRRSLTWGLGGAVLGLNVTGDRTMAAARRPPPSPPKEKQDPNVSGVVAKVLASKKRKEALKEAAAKLREKGKTSD